MGSRPGRWLSKPVQSLLASAAREAVPGTAAERKQQQKLYGKAGEVAKKVVSARLRTCGNEAANSSAKAQIKLLGSP
jgi:hypothetical protein